MSIVFLTNHNEFIQDIKDPDNIIKTKKFTSTNLSRIKHQPAVKYDQKSNKKILQTTSKLYSHKTMGYPEVTLPNPCDFLKKNRGITFQKIPNHKCSSKDSPPVPKKSEQYIFTYKKKNFQQLNKEMIQNFKPKQPKPKVVFTRNGSTYELCNSGVIPSNIYSPNFGKTPKYIEQIKNNLKKKRLTEIEKQKPDLSLPEGIRYLSNEERFNILNGLRKKWLEVTLQFNTIPSIVDTIPLKLRKSATEEYLRQLERDLLLLENNPFIYICDKDFKCKI